MDSDPLREDLAALLSVRRGHFRLESGHHGDLWLDLDRLFLRPGRLDPFVDELARGLAPLGVEAVCGPLVGGAFVAYRVAGRLGVEFCYAERVARLRGTGLYAAAYRLPAASREAVAGKKVAVVDDAVNAGSAARGCVAELRACGATPVAVGSLVVLNEAAARYAEEQGLILNAVLRLSNNLWPPAECPLCASRTPLEDLTGWPP